MEDTFRHLYATYFGEQQHEQAEIETLPLLLQGIEVFIDVGASLGQYTYYANRILSDARIVAVEADPDRYAELEANCAKWDTGKNEIVPVHAAVTDSRGTGVFYNTGGRISGGLFPVAERPAEYKPVEVPLITLNDLHQQGRTFVKIDVEGSEMRVMLGASDLIESGAEFLTEITWWGDRERGHTPLSFLRWLHAQRLAVRKNTSRRNSNYHLYPGRGGYMRVVPLLTAKYVWGRYMPIQIRKQTESLLGAMRLRRHH